MAFDAGGRGGGIDGYMKGVLRWYVVITSLFSWLHYWDRVLFCCLITLLRLSTAMCYDGCTSSDSCCCLHVVACLRLLRIML